MTPAPVLAAAAAAALLAWLAIALRPARHWDLRPVAEAEPAPADPPAWPPVRVLVPARNEAACLPRTLPALLAQDYPGDWAVVLVDDRSDDGTAALARALGGGRLTVLPAVPCRRAGPARSGRSPRPPARPGGRPTSC